jgi:soluble lytic murein transglycosylase-like protein
VDIGPPELIVEEANWPDLLVWHFKRGLALAQRGELALAGAEWGRVADLGKTVGGIAKALALAAATYDVYPQGVSWAREASLEFGADDPRRAGFERLGQPVAYYDAVTRAALEHGAHPDLVWSVMRQESLYDPHAVSRAGALGLLQIMPATLARIVTERGLDPLTPDALFRPDLNIELGTRFLMDRLGEFRGALMPALASYNAGEGKVGQWIDLAGGDTEEVFLECVGYSETYTYIRRVIWLAWIYRNFYPGIPGSGIPDTGTR